MKPEDTIGDMQWPLIIDQTLELESTRTTIEIIQVSLRLYALNDESSIRTIVYEGSTSLVPITTI